MKHATIEYETEAGGKRVAVLPSIDIAGDDPLIVIGGVLIALSDRIAALEKQLAMPVQSIPSAQIHDPIEEQLEMDLTP